MLPALQDDTLPRGLHAASLQEVVARFGVGSPARERGALLLREVVGAASNYGTIKRVLVWGSWVTSKAEPNDLDYTLIVSVAHRMVTIAPEHRRFLKPSEARRVYGADINYVVIADYPLEPYLDRLNFVLEADRAQPRGAVEIHLRGEEIA